MGLDEAHAGIKIVVRNGNNLRYTDDTILVASLMTQTANNLPAVPETQVRFLGCEDPLPTPVYLPGESHAQRSPGRLQSMGSQRVR